jgi:hypothetical protein
MLKVRQTLGVITDIDADELPLNAFSSAQNCSINNGYIGTSSGHETVFGTPTVTPYWCMNVLSTSTSYWMYASLTKMYVTDGTTHTNITRQTAAVDVDYTATALQGWHGGVIAGIPFINNGVDDPQMWSPATTGTKLASLTYESGGTWSSKNYQCKSLRAYKNYLVAMNVTKAGVSTPYMVKWSDAAEPGLVPQDWDETDSTKDAGEWNLVDGGDICVDGGALRDVFIIYKERSTYTMSFIGGDLVMAFAPLFKNSGILATNCWQEHKGLHYVMTRGDLIVHDGFQLRSIADARIRQAVFDEIDATNYEMSFVSLHPSKDEVWFCYPTSNQSYVNKAAVYSVTDDMWSFRNLPNVMFIDHGIVSASEDTTWAAAGNWDTDTTTWNQVTYNPTSPALLFASPANTKLYKGDTTNQEDAVNKTTYIERTGLAYIDNQTIDETAYKYIAGIYPKFDAPSGTAIDIYVGVQDVLTDPITWSSPQTFTVGTDSRVDFDLAGRYWGMKFQTNANVTWGIKGYDADVRMQGYY